jgi:hypothetical protein
MDQFGSTEWRGWDEKHWKTYFRERGIRSKIPSFNGFEISKAKDGALFFADHGIHDFSGVELAAITHLEKWSHLSSSQIMAVTYGAVSHHYSRLYSEEMNDLKIPAIALLRIDTGNYFGNLPECLGYETNPKGQLLEKVSEKLLEIDTSLYDWKESLRLPLEFDLEVAKLFGFYWGLGNMYPFTKVSHGMMLSGKEIQREFLLDTVKPLMEKTHNIKVGWEDQSERGEVLLGNSFVDLSGCYLRKTSKALTSYLSNEHRFPSQGNKDRTTNRNEKPHLPKLPWSDEIIDSFVLGLILSRGNDGTYNCGGAPIERIAINGEGEYGRELDALLTVRGHGHSKQEKNNKWVINLNKKPTLYFRSLIEA